MPAADGSALVLPWCTGAVVGDVAGAELPELSEATPDHAIRCFEWRSTPAIDSEHIQIPAAGAGHERRALLAVDHLSAEYRSRGAQQQVVRGVSFTVREGSYVGAFGLIELSQPSTASSSVMSSRVMWRWDGNFSIEAETGHKTITTQCIGFGTAGPRTPDKISRKNDPSPWIWGSDMIPRRSKDLLLLLMRKVRRKFRARSLAETCRQMTPYRVTSVVTPPHSASKWYLVLSLTFAKLGR